MARPTPTLIEALLQTIQNIEAGDAYQWGHMGSCNCGHLAQALTSRSKADIHAAALRRSGDWGQQAYDYCPKSGLPLDFIISEMLDAGLTLDDIHYLERLNDPKVLAKSPKRWFKQNNKEDLLLYLKTWVAILQDELQALVDSGQVVLIQPANDPATLKDAV